MRILVTGSSGFIGRHLVRELASHGHEVAGLDRKRPTDEPRAAAWFECDLMDAPAIATALREFQPDAVVHLAARTSMKKSAPGADRYAPNTTGTRHLIEAIRQAGSVRRALYASTKYVHRGAGIRIPPRTYAPDTDYGASKAAMEEIVWQTDGGCAEWCILRPTTVWGPDVGWHYRRFLDLVRTGRYFHAGNRAGRKHLGYVENVAHQIRRFVEAPADALTPRIFYLGDYDAIPVDQWADAFQRAFGSRRIPRIPLGLARGAAFVGDLIAAAGWRNFPFTRFRLKNLTEDDLCDLEPTRLVCGELPVSLEDAVARTVAWHLKHPR